MRPKTVLIVEDEILIRMALADILDDAGFVVFEAGNVLEAIAILGTHRVDVLVTDIDMPGGLSGLDLARHVRSYDKALGILVTSGGHDRSDITLPDGTAYLAKPYRFEEVLAAVSMMLPEPIALQQAAS